jgi:hypothetical protein
MRYRYEKTNSEYKSYCRDVDNNSIRQFGKDLKQLMRLENKSESVADFIDRYRRFCPVTLGECTINRISRHIENQLINKTVKYVDYNFDYSAYKFGVTYTNSEYKKIAAKFNEYMDDVAAFKKRKYGDIEDADGETFDEETEKQQLDAYFNLLLNDCLDIVNGDEEKLNDIIVDICYTTPKQKYFAWKIAGRTMILALLRKNDNRITIPVQSEDGDILFKGKRFKEETYELLF